MMAFDGEDANIEGGFPGGVFRTGEEKLPEANEAGRETGRSGCKDWSGLSATASPPRGSMAGPPHG